MATTQLIESAGAQRPGRLGVWVFLASELMFFGPLFLGYVHGRIVDYTGFVAASQHMSLWLGTTNTAVLLTSSFTVALAGRYPHRHRALLGITAAFGVAFLAIKMFEYSQHWHPAVLATDGEAMFYFLYFALTGVHAVHMLVGIGLVLWAIRARGAVELVGLYWHFVDVIWIFLFPMFYLLERYR